MKMKKLLFSITILCGLQATLNPGFGQGCSDAGACSIGGLASGGHEVPKQNQISVLENFGISETAGTTTLIFSSGLEGTFKILPKTSASIKVTHQIATGPLATKAGFGNIIGSLSRTLINKSNQVLSANIGIVVPPNRSNFTKNGKGLPMEYQSSLGSFEMFGGLSFTHAKWKFALGYQHPFQRNNNSFLQSDWLNDADAQNYFESNRLRRGDDLIMRVERLLVSKRSKIYASILPILRLQKDEIIKGGQIIKLDGSNQLTLNINFTYERPISENLVTKFIIGGPVIARETRADGLTRLAVLTFSMSYRF